MAAHIYFNKDLYTWTFVNFHGMDLWNMYAHFQHQTLCDLTREIMISVYMFEMKPMKPINFWYGYWVILQYV